jgi:hypothetical protein
MVMARHSQAVMRLHFTFKERLEQQRDGFVAHLHWQWPNGRTAEVSGSVEPNQRGASMAAAQLM